MLKNEAYFFGLLIAIISSVFLFISLYNKASDPNLSAFWKGGNGYVSDEVWYVNSARNLLRDFYGTKTYYIDSKGYVYYTVVFTDFKSRDKQINIILSKISNVNGKINKTYTKFPAICFQVPYNSNFEITLENVTMFFTGFPYPDVQFILNYYNFEHPPLGKIIIGTSMLLYRDEPIAWRIPSIIFSSLIPLIVFLIVTRLTDPIAGAAASVIPHLDQLMNNMGFIAFLDVHLAFFIALSLLFAVYNRYLLSAIMIGLAAAAKLPAIFIIPALYIFLRVKGNNVFKSFYVSFIVPIIVWFIVNLSIIIKLGFSRWINEIIGALKWHTTSRPAGPPSSTPWGWFINENPFYFHFDPTYSASVNPVLYISVVVFLIFTTYLTVYRSKDFAAPSLWFLGLFFGFILIYILGNRTLYSFYAFSFIPMVYVIFVANIYSMFLPPKTEKYKNYKEEIKNFLRFYYKYFKYFFINIYSMLKLYYYLILNLFKGRFKIPEINILSNIFPYETELRIIVTFYTAIMFLSFFIHLPTQTGLLSIGLYSDIVAKFFTSGIGKDYLGIPYYNYFFEYPVIIGIITYISSAVAWLLYPPLFSNQINPSGLFIYYLFQSLAIYLAGYIMIIDLYYFAKKLKIESYYLLFLLGLPSFLVYGIYNWDIIAISFAIRALRFFTEERLIASALCLSIAIATKIFPAVVLLAIFRELLYKEINKYIIFKSIGYIFVTISLVFLYYLPFIYLNPQILYQQYQYHANWYIEGSWLTIFYENPWKHNAQILTIILSSLFIFLIIYYTSLKEYKFKEERLIETSFLLIASIIFSSYVHTPQMQLMILPLLILQRIDKFILLFIFDFLNSLVILTWFNYKEWGLLLFKYYPPDELGGPLNKFAIPTISAIFRDFILLYFILYILFKRKFS